MHHFNNRCGLLCDFHLAGRLEFIAISNSPFEYQETYGIAKVRFLQHYDMAKQIVLPYDNQTIKLLDIQKWHKVN